MYKRQMNDGTAQTLTAAGATFSRFLYSAPFILLGLVAYLALSATPLPPLGPGFWAHGVVGGTAQILATVCVVLLFKQRNFAVGITFKKTEVILTVLVVFSITIKVESARSGTREEQDLCALCAKADLLRSVGADPGAVDELASLMALQSS